MSLARLLPDGLVRQARAGSLRAQGQLATTVAAGLAGVGDPGLERAMAIPPLRRAILDAIFWQMPRQLDARRARGVRLSARWVISSRGGRRADVYDLTVESGRARVRRGEGGNPPKVTITVDGAEFLRLVIGTADPMRAYFNGSLTAAGDIMAAARLASLFRVPRNGSRKQNANRKPGRDRAY